MITFGSAVSSRAITTFCWLPPDSDAGARLRARRRARRSPSAAAAPARRASRGERKPRARVRPQLVVAQREVLGEVELEHEPRRWRSSAMGLTPAAASSRGPACVTSCPATVIVPGVGERRPMIASISSLWPLASTPASPTISPARTSKRHVVDRRQPAVVARGDVLEREQRLARRVVGLLDAQQHVAADHQRRQRALGRALGGDGVDLLAAAQDRHAVGDVQHLVELVRDEDDRRARPPSACAGRRTGPAPPARSAPRSARRARAPSRRGTARAGSPRAAGCRRRCPRPSRPGRRRARTAPRARAPRAAAAL